MIGAWPTRPDLVVRCNLDGHARYAGEPLLGRVPEAGQLNPPAFEQLATVEPGPIAGREAERVF